MWKLPLTVMLLLSACSPTVGPGNASTTPICSIPTPTFTQDELQALSERTLSELDVFAERLEAACGR